ncbi:hypothetical protein IE53DRAFT_370917 [Violaceomyces palustris]|uniref:Uncharacterized protein n=1 Tax=Violaceomyces palustris TaxID=1673888 RepID=A0ACD0NQL8_9BASI|nr:hypothetical protein IE53DRAFT_370917 [Violaceomyces palustris]
MSQPHPSQGGSFESTISNSSDGTSGSNSLTDNAFVTLLTSDHYLPGALVLAHSIRQAHRGRPDAESKPFHIVALVTPQTLSVQSIKALSRSGVFDWVIGVEQIGFAQLLAEKADLGGDGGNVPVTCIDKASQEIADRMAKNLSLLGRPDLVATLSKLHVWRLGKDAASSFQGDPISSNTTAPWRGYDKLVFLDADMLVLRPIDHLFELPGDPSFAASPDTGWPDAFNSGLMLLKPSLKTFEGIRKFAKEKGSWDGADQGLLNDWFGADSSSATPGETGAPGGGWTRLSFRYNVTSHGGYTFAPAYQRYGDSIMAAHYIGQHKPWNRPRPDGNANPNPHSDQVGSDGRQIGPSEADYLLALWHDTYASLYPSRSPTSPQTSVEIIHTSRGVEVVERRPFTVPTYHAVWDAQASDKDEDSRPPEVGFNRQGESQYLSLPLDGRTSLIAPEPKVPSPPPKAVSSSPAHTWTSPSPSTPAPAHEHTHTRNHDHAHASPSPHPEPGVTSTTHEATQPHQRGQEIVRPFSPPQLEWNPAIAPPPSGSGPSNHQMRNPPNTYYENAWDGPSKTPRTLADQKAAFFNPAGNNGAGSWAESGVPGYIPPQLKKDNFFQNLGSDMPDPSRVKPVFPWEQAGAEPKPAPTRVFPDEARIDSGAHTSASGTSDEQARKPASPQPPVQEAFQPPPPPPRRGLPTNLVYTNAWDEVGSIGKYAEWWTKAASNRKTKGVQASPDMESRSSQTGPSYRDAASGPSYSSTGSRALERSQSSRDRGSSTARDDYPPFDSAAEDGGQSDSRDGDDESSSGEDSSDDDDDKDDGRDGSAKRSGKCSRDGSEDEESDSEVLSIGIRSPTWAKEKPGKGYTKKAENNAIAHGNVSPKSPRTAQRSVGAGHDSSQNGGTFWAAATATGTRRDLPAQGVQVAGGGNGSSGSGPGSRGAKSRIRPENWEATSHSRFASNSFDLPLTDSSYLRGAEVGRNGRGANGDIRGDPHWDGEGREGGGTRRSWNGSNGSTSSGATSPSQYLSPSSPSSHRFIAATTPAFSPATGSHERVTMMMPTQPSSSSGMRLSYSSTSSGSNSGHGMAAGYASGGGGSNSSSTSTFNTPLSRSPNLANVKGVVVVPGGGTRQWTSFTRNAELAHLDLDADAYARFT